MDSIKFVRTCILGEVGLFMIGLVMNLILATWVIRPELANNLNDLSCILMVQFIPALLVILIAYMLYETFWN